MLSPMEIQERQKKIRRTHHIQRGLSSHSISRSQNSQDTSQEN